MVEKTNKLNERLDLALCIFSSNSYKDIWEIFIHFWRKNCPDLEIPVYIFTSEKIKNNNSFYKIIYPKNLNSNDPWSNRMNECLNQIYNKNIITTTEDAIINKKIDLKKFNLALKYFYENDLDYLKLSPYFPNKSNEIINKFISHADWELHRVNITKALWKKKSLISLLKNDESINSFDMFASIRANELKMNVQHCDFTVLNYLEIIHGGKFTLNSKKILEECNYFDKNNRKFNSKFNIKFLTNNFKLYTYSVMPKKLKKMLIEYGLIGYKNKYNKNLKN